MAGYTDALIKDLEDAQAALKALQEEITTPPFDPYDPDDLERVIGNVEAAIDEKAGRHAGNPIVKLVVRRMKDEYRRDIAEQAAQRRAARPL